MQVLSGREMLETVFKALIAEHGLTDIALALHNACVHGEVFPSISNAEVERLYSEGLEPLLKIAREIEGE